MREGSPRQQREIGAGASVPPSQPPFWRPSPPRTGGRAGHLGAPSSLRSGAPGADPGGASPCAQPPCTVVPSSNVQGQLGLKPPARDRAPSFSQREAVSGRKNRVSVTGPLAPSASAWQSWGRETQRAAQSQAPWRWGGVPAWAPRPPACGSVQALCGPRGPRPLRLERGLAGCSPGGLAAAASPACGHLPVTPGTSAPAAPGPTRASAFPHACGRRGGAPCPRPLVTRRCHAREHTCVRVSTSY